MCPKRRQNLHLAIQRNKHTEDEQGIIYDYMLFQGVLRQVEFYGKLFNE